MKHQVLRSFVFLLSLLLLSKEVLPSKDGKCRALALRGGGAKGAYEVGVLKGMAKYLDP